MNFRKIIVSLACGWAFCASLRADDLAMNNPATANNPYSTIIVTRNVFNLNPPVVDTNPVVDPGLPKITPNGIVSEFGRFQVLFKVTPISKPGKPADDQYYTMSEGERQDDIEVMHIDNENGIVTFKNHGTVQEIPLSVADSNGSGAPTPSSAPGNHGFNPGNNNGDNSGPGNRIIRFGNRGAGPGGFNRPGQDNSNGAANGGNDPFNGSSQSRTYQPEAPNMTPDQAAQIIEMQRAQALDSGDPGKAALFPTTKYTQQLMNGQ